MTVYLTNQEHHVLAVLTSRVGSINITSRVRSSNTDATILDLILIAHYWRDCFLILVAALAL